MYRKANNGHCCLSAVLVEELAIKWPIDALSFVLAAHLFQTEFQVRAIQKPIKTAAKYFLPDKL